MEVRCMSLGQMQGSRATKKPNMKLPVCSVAMTVDCNKNTQLQDIMFRNGSNYWCFWSINRLKRLNFCRKKKIHHCWIATNLLFFLQTIYIQQISLWSLLADLFSCKSSKYPWLCCVYLRAKEKWAEALGEKFLGLSWGLVPARRNTKKTEIKNKLKGKNNLQANKIQ